MAKSPNVRSRRDPEALNPSAGLYTWVCPKTCYPKIPLLFHHLKLFGSGVYPVSKHTMEKGPVEVVEVVEVDVQSLTSSRTSDAKYGKDRCWNVDHI